MSESAFGSVLSIPKDLLDNLESIDKKVAELQETSSATSRIYNDAFHSMTLSTSTLEGALQKVLDKMASLGDLSTQASNSLKMGENMSGMAEGAKRANESMTGIIGLLNRMRTLLQDSSQMKGGFMFHISNLVDAVSVRISGMDAKFADFKKKITELEMQEAKYNKSVQDILLKSEQTITTNAKINLEQAKQNKLYAKAAVEAAKLARAQAQLAQAQAMAATAQERANAASERAAKNATIRQYSDNASSALSFAYNSVNVSTYNRRAIAIKVLENAIKNLKNTDVDYQKNLQMLSARYKELKNEQDNIVSSYREMQVHQSRLMDTAGQLSRAFALLFSVSQIKGYISHIAETRGYFELQQKSLQAILQNKQQADDIFNKTIALALESPFRAKELITYTKQLAAYRIENEKLYETTKNIADISAGLGVDAQRLILAYGQVKAAAYLRGCLGYDTPIRMFDGSIKMVQDVVIGDVLINEKGEKVNVKELIRGREQMYVVRQSDGLDYRVNENHILTLYKDGCLHDIYVREYSGDYLGARYDDGKLTYGAISIEKDIVDDYFGFVLDGNKRFQLGDGTITHNTEVRQFTEAGINMYGELQKLFKERDNADYTTAQIVDMISKRKVAFEDVEEIFNRLTNKGGLFYNMQRIQVETLQGKLGKLKDAIDQMQNAIGKANEGAFKGVVDFGITLVQNWEAIANAGQALAGVLVLLKMQSMATGVAMRNVLTAEFATAPVKVKLFSTAMAAAGTSIKNLALSMKAAFVSNPVTAGLMIAAGIAYKLYSRYSEVQEKLKELNKDYSDTHRQITAINDEYTYLAKSESKNIDAKRDAIKRLLESANQSGLKIKIDVDNIDGGKLDEEFNKIKGKYEAFALTLKRIRARMAESGGLLTDNIDEDAKDYAEAAQKIIAHSEMIDDAIAQVKANYDKIPQSAQKFFATIKAGRMDGEGDISYYVRMKDALREISMIAGQQSNGIVPWMSQWRAAAMELHSSFVDLNKQSKEFINELESNMPELKKIADKNAVRSIIDYVAVKGQWDEMAAELAKQHFDVPLNLDTQDVTRQVSWIDQYITDFFNGKSYGVKLDVATDSKAFSSFIGKGDDAAKAAKSWAEIGKRWGTIMANKAKLTVDDELANILYGTRMRVKVGDVVDTQDLKALFDDYKKMATDLALSLGVNPFEKTQAKQNRDILSEQIALLKEMQTRYEKLRTLMRPQDAADNVLEYYKKSLDDVRMPESVMSSFVPTREGVVEALDKIIPTISDFKKRMDAQNMRAEMKIEIDKDALDKSLEDAKDAVEEAFNSMKVYADMRKMGMSDEYIQSLLGALPKTYSDVRRVIEEQLGKTDAEGFQKQYQESIIKLEKQTADERLAIIKQLFNDYAANLDDQLQLDTWYAEERIKIEQNVADETIKAQMRANLDKKYSEKTDMNTWKNFQKSDSYISLFENLDYSTSDAIKKMVEQLDGMRDSLKNLPPEQLKTIVGLIDKLKSELRQRNPIKALADSFKELNQATNKTDSQKAFANISLALKEVSSQFGELSNASSQLTGMLENFGLNVPGEVSAVLDGIGGALDGLASIDRNKPMSIVTGMIKSVSSVGNMIANVFGFGNKDNKLQKQIEEMEKKVNKLKTAYDNLQTAMNDAWDLSTMEEYNRMMQDNIRMQIKSIEEMIRLEEEKKRTDKEKIEEYKAQIEELEKTLEESLNNYYSQLGGFGSEANFKSAAEDFAEAWFDAYNECGNTLDALKGKFNEYFDNLIKKQIAYRASKKSLEPLLRALDDALDPEGEGGSALTRKEKDAIMRLKESGLAAFDQLARELTDAMGISPASSVSLSKLQQGISSINETQSSAIEALLNSMRSFLARQSTDVSAIRAIMEAAGNISDNSGGSTLAELRTQTSILRDIRTIMQGIVRNSGHPKMGAGVKVFID